MPRCERRVRWLYGFARFAPIGREFDEQQRRFFPGGGGGGGEYRLPPRPAVDVLHDRFSFPVVVDGALAAAAATVAAAASPPATLGPVLRPRRGGGGGGGEAKTPRDGFGEDTDLGELGRDPLQPDEEHGEEGGIGDAYPPDA